MKINRIWGKKSHINEEVSLVRLEPRMVREISRLLDVFHVKCDKDDYGGAMIVMIFK